MEKNNSVESHLRRQNKRKRESLYYLKALLVLIITLLIVGMALLILELHFQNKQISTISEQLTIVNVEPLPEKREVTHVHIPEQKCPICGWNSQIYPSEDGWYIECLNPDCRVHTHRFKTTDLALHALENSEVFSNIL